MKHTVKQLELKNGAKGLLVNIPDATVMTFDINFRAGEYLVDPNKWETPHLMEHILLGANELFPSSRSFQAELEKNGAYSNASTGSYDITYEAECADFEWDRILGLLLTAISKPLFLQEEFDAEFGNVKEELMGRSNNHFRHLNLALRQKYGFCIKTDQERLRLIDNVTLEDIRKHYELTHRSPNMRFIIAGNITKSREEILEKLLSAIELPQDGYRTPLPEELPEKLAVPLYIENMSVENMYFYIDTFMRRRATEGEYYALSLANILLTETLHSRIFGQAREKGLVYGVSSSYSRLLGSTNFWVGAQVMPKNAGALLKIIQKEINELKLGKVSPDELNAAKLYALGRYQRSAQTVSSTAGIYAWQYFYEEGVEEFAKIPEKIHSVSQEQLTAVMISLFNEQVNGMGVLGSCGQEFADNLYQEIQPLWQEVA